MVYKIIFFFAFIVLDYCLNKPTNHKSYQNVKEYKTPKDTKGIYNLNKILFFYPSKTRQQQ